MAVPPTYQLSWQGVCALYKEYVNRSSKCDSNPPETRAATARSLRERIQGALADLKMPGALEAIESLHQLGFIERKEDVIFLGPPGVGRLCPLVLRWILRTVFPLFRAINDAVTGHIEKLSTIMGNLVEEAGGEQYRCPQCGSFGPKVSDH